MCPDPMGPCGLGTRLRLVGEEDVNLQVALISMCKVVDCFLVNPSSHKYQILGFLEFGGMRVNSLNFGV